MPPWCPLRGSGPRWTMILYGTDDDPDEKVVQNCACEVYNRPKAGSMPDSVAGNIRSKMGVYSDAPAFGQGKIAVKNVK